MNERELRQQLAEARGAFDTAIQNEVPVEELRTLKDKVKEIREKLDIVIEARGLDTPPVDTPPGAEGNQGDDENRSIDELTEDEVETRYKSVFLRAVRGRNLSRDDIRTWERVQDIRRLSSNEDENGGFVVPLDASTQINEFRRRFTALQSVVTTETVSTNAGTRVLEADSDMIPFANIEEWDEIDDIENPQFQQKKYDIRNYAGILPIPNTLLQDNDANLLTYIYRWIARKSVLTRNLKIINVLESFKKMDVQNFDDIKAALNVELDPDIRSGAIFITNQDGFNYLDTLKDDKGNYILKPNPADETQYRVQSRQVVVLSNRVLKTESKKAPLFVGMMAEGVILYDRNVYEILSTKTGGKSFTRNTTDIRVIDRFDVRKWDDEAVIYGQIDLTKEVEVDA